MKSSNSSSSYPTKGYVPGVKFADETEASLSWLYRQQHLKNWNTGGLGEGVVVRSPQGDFVCCPSMMKELEDELYITAEALNAKVSTTDLTKYTY